MVDTTTNVGPTVEAAEKLKLDWNYPAAVADGLSDAKMAEIIAESFPSYDIGAKRAEGVTDREIIAELSNAQLPRKEIINFKQMRNDGLSKEDIARYLVTNQGFDYDAYKRQGRTDDDIITEFSTVEDAPVKAFTRGAARGSSTTAGFMGGAAAGIQAGMPFGPYAAAGGMIIGGLSGLALSNGLNQFFLSDDQYLNLGAEAAGETIAGSVMPAPIPYLRLSQTPSLGASLFIHDFVKKQGGKTTALTPLDKLTQTATQSPFRYLGFEAGLAGATGVAGFAAEEEAPGDALTRMGYELTTGVLAATAPSLVISRVIGSNTDALKGLFTGREDRRLNRLGRQLVEALQAGGENVPALIKEIQDIRKSGRTTELEKRGEELGVDVGPVTMSVRLQSPVLGIIDAALNKKLAKGPTVEKAAVTQNIEALNAIRELLIDMDDPAALAMAAQLQKETYDSMLTALLTAAEADAATTAGKAFDGTQAGAAKAGTIIRTVTEDVISTARDQEKALYAKVNKTEQADASNVVSKFDEIRADLLPESPFPALITRFVNRVSGRDMEGVEDSFIAGYRETADEIVQARTAADKKKEKFQSFEVKFPSARDRVDGELRYGVSIDQAIAEIKSDLGSFDNMIRDLANVAANYREKGLDVVGSDLSAVERARVASYAENLIDFLQAEQKVINLQQYQTNYSQRLREFEAADSERPTDLPPVTVGDLTAFRSEMLTFARDARAAGKFRDANFYGRMAEAALEDLGLKSEVPVGQLPTENQVALRNAHNFSRALNDVFTRAFAGDVLAKTRAGADRLPPELLADKVFGGSANATNLKLLQLRDVAKFMAENAGEDFAETSAAQLDTLVGAQETILRTVTSRFYNPETGRVNMSGLQTFLRNNDETLRLFPELRAELNEAATAQKILADASKQDSLFRKNLENELALGAFLGNDELPGNTIGELIGDPSNRKTIKNPAANIRATMKAAKQAGDNVFDGLRSAIMAHAYTFAGGPDDAMVLTAYRDYFTKPFGPKQPSLLSIMREQGMFSDTEAARFNTLLREAAFIENNVLNPNQKTLPVQDVPGALYDLVVRVAGARSGTEIAQQLGMGQSIQLPGYFAELARNKFVNFPTTYFNDLMLAASQDAKLMELLLRRGLDAKKNANASLKFDRQLYGALYNAGLVPSKEEIENNMPPFTGMMLPRSAAAAEMPNIQEIEQYLQQLQPPSATVQTQAQTAPLTPVSQQPPAPPAQASGGAAPVNRGAYAAMFPNDPISPLINQQQNTQIQQGIGSLGPR